MRILGISAKWYWIVIIDDCIWIRHSITYARLYSNECLIRECERIVLFKYDWLIDNDWDADSFEYYITFNSHVTPSEHLLSLHPSVFWISRLNQMKEISSSVESIVIQGGVGRDDEKSFNLSNLPSLITLEMGCDAFCSCHSIVFESMNDWMNDESDLTQLQSIVLEWGALCGDYATYESNELIMRSMNDNGTDWSDLPSLSTFKGTSNFG